MRLIHTKMVSQTVFCSFHEVKLLGFLCWHPLKYWELFQGIGQFYIQVMWLPPCWSPYIKAGSCWPESTAQHLFSHRNYCVAWQNSVLYSGGDINPQQWTLEAESLSLSPLHCAQRWNTSKTKPALCQGTVCWTSILSALLGPLLQ